MPKRTVDSSSRVAPVPAGELLCRLGWEIVQGQIKVAGANLKVPDTVGLRIHTRQEAPDVLVIEVDLGTKKERNRRIKAEGSHPGG